MGRDSPRSPKEAGRQETKVTRRVVRRPLARADLLDHFIFIGQANPDAAERFLDAAQTTFATLARFPLMGRAWRSGHAELSVVRVWSIQRFRNYLVFYRPFRNGIEVLRVLHGARDLGSALEAGGN